jgi:hypothetical protein
MTGGGVPGWSYRELLPVLRARLRVCVMAPSWQDRDGAKTTLLSAYLDTPIRHVFADSGFVGRLDRHAIADDGGDRA